MRLDICIFDKFSLKSREYARTLIKNGDVSVNGVTVKKAGFEVNGNEDISVNDSLRYVSRGGLKLEKAISSFGIPVNGRVALDIGASTGGFTDCLLQNGASKVFACDVGHGQLAEKLKNDPRVVNMEGTDIRTVTPDDLGGCADIITVDVSFISLKMILPKVYELLKENACASVLIKPQFEAGRSGIGKNGIVKDRKVHLRVLRETDEFARDTGFVCEKYTFSPVKGGSGNIEYLVKLCRRSAPAVVHDLKALVDSAFEKL